MYGVTPTCPSDGTALTPTARHRELGAGVAEVWYCPRCRKDRYLTSNRTKNASDSAYGYSIITGVAEAEEAVGNVERAVGELSKDLERLSKQGDRTHEDLDHAVRLARSASQGLNLVNERVAEIKRRVEELGTLETLATRVANLEIALRQHVEIPHVSSPRKRTTRARRA